MYGTASVEPAPLGMKPSVLLGTLSLRRVARVIRGLGSDLLSIVYRQEEDKRMLIYTFDVAGEVQPFHLAATGEPIDSIADLYPSAARYEQELRQAGLRFQPPPQD